MQGTALLAMLVALLFTSLPHPPRRGARMSDVLDQILQVGFLAAILRIATPLVFATLGEMFSERAGVLNLGIEGIMLISAMTGFSAAYYLRRSVDRRRRGGADRRRVRLPACGAHRGARASASMSPASG